YRLNELTLTKNRKQLTDKRLLLTGTGKDLATAGKRLEKPDLIREFRRKLLQIVVEETRPLLGEDYNFAVRVQAALILGELNLMEPDEQKEVGLEAFAPAAKPLCRVIEDPKQPEGVKIVSVLSLIRILHLAALNVEQKREIATALVSELNRKGTNYWYQTRLAE